MGVREARTGEIAAVMTVIDAALLAIDAGTVRERVESGEALVYAEGPRVLGALVLDGDHIDALAVRRARREQGIARALVEAALDRHGRLTADFRDELAPFYEGLGFAVEERGRRSWGVLTDGTVGGAG